MDKENAYSFSDPLIGESQYNYLIVFKKANVALGISGGESLNYALITIDVEAWHGDRPIDRFIWGETDSGFYGLEMMMNLFDSLDAKGLFFVDFAECHDYGEEEVVQVARFIKDRGHTVGVHLHPDHIMDPKREFLFEYTKEEQRRLIEYVTEKYKEAMGENPIYFRAGKYSANRDTLDLIGEFGYLYDFSEYYGKSWCGIKPPITADHLCRFGSICEIPVTSFIVVELFGKARIDKVDMEMSSFVLRRISDIFTKVNQNQVFVLFGHSFSFLKNRYSEDMGKLSFDNRKFDDFRKSVSYIKGSSSYELIDPSEIDFLAQKGELDFNDPDTRPSVKLKSPWTIIRYFYSTSWRIKGFNKNARLFIGSNLAVGFIVLVLLTLIFTGARS